MANYNKKITDTNIRIGEVQLNYVNVFEKRRNEDGSEGKYSVQIRIPKTDKKGIQLIEDAIEAAKVAGKSKTYGGKIPSRLQTPLRDGDEEHPDDETYEGMMFFNASTSRKPGVKVLEDGAIRDALDDDDCYSGCYGAVTVNFYPYSVSGNNGVAAGLGNVIKTRDGERVSGGRSADADFGDMGDDLLD